MTRLALVFAAIAVLGGCASGTTKLPEPSGRLMAKPEPFPRVSANDDARAKLVEAALVHQRNASRQRDLQEWARTATDQ
jgi:hypothetical protein